jgi:hypothetical protein
MEQLLDELFMFRFRDIVIQEYSRVEARSVQGYSLCYNMPI